MQVMQEARYAAPVHMMKLTQEREVTPYVWVHPDENRCGLLPNAL